MDHLLQIENILKSVVFIHALFIFLGALEKGNTQLRDVLRLKITGLSVNEMPLSDVCKSDYPVELMEDERVTLGKLIAGGHYLVPALKILGYIPILCYAVSYLVKYIPSQSLQGNIQISDVSGVIFAFALGVQLSYLIIKAASGFPEILMNLHPRYKGKTSWFWVWVDWFPLINKK